MVARKSTHQMIVFWIIALLPSLPANAENGIAVAKVEVDPTTDLRGDGDRKGVGNSTFRSPQANDP